MNRHKNLCSLIYLSYAEAMGPETTQEAYIQDKNTYQITPLLLSD